MGMLPPPPPPPPPNKKKSSQRQCVYCKFPLNFQDQCCSNCGAPSKETPWK